MQTQTKESQAKLTPKEALQMLKDGNANFVQNLRGNRNLQDQVKATANGQAPFATVLSCMDSRTSAELIFDQGLGDIFSIRVAGNVSNTDILGSIEYAVAAVETKVLLVLGHTSCGAVGGACNNFELGNLTSLLNKIQPAIEAETTVTENRTGSNADFVNKVAAINVRNVIEEIKKESPTTANIAKDSSKLIIVGGIYDVVTGKVTIYE